MEFKKDRVEQLLSIDGKNLYSTKELIEKLNLSHTTIKKYRENGRLIGRKHGKSFYYSEESIKRYYESFHENQEEMLRKGGRQLTH